MDLGRRVRFGLLSGGAKFEFRGFYNALLGERDGLTGESNLI